MSTTKPGDPDRIRNEATERYLKERDKTPIHADPSGCTGNEGAQVHMVVTTTSAWDVLIDRDGLRAQCPACGAQFTVSREIYGRALRADALYLEGELSTYAPARREELVATIARWREDADRLDPDPRQTSLFGDGS